ncbi:MAG: hypothetical protein EMLJLAPB_00536 [Candidatus Argoarchaeum ethanivorans]|uniref:Glycosyl transferase family 1 domain-containing protein n=1 Tax=Candidatus Argoarchaeum ethanivorans TaxID=2608793 RepID=A0A811TCY5_9EURY|nr:MAG: hypothetical protein EMLJLAPB_00536 [Candidatus Argoarchaeum ethanivorans]
MQDIVLIKFYEYVAMGKPVITTKIPGVMKEFGEDRGIIYVDKPEDAFGRAVGMIEEYGSKAWGFVENCGWDDVVDEFERVLEEVIDGAK